MNNSNPAKEAYHENTFTGPLTEGHTPLVESFSPTKKGGIAKDNWKQFKLELIKYLWNFSGKFQPNVFYKS